MDEKTRKLMTLHKVLHPREDLYVSRKEGRFASVKDCIDASRLGLEEYIKKSKERMVAAASKSNRSIGISEKLQLESWNGKKNDCMDISSDKLVRLHRRKPGRD